MARIWEAHQSAGQRGVVGGLVFALRRLGSETPSEYLDSLRGTVAPPESAPDPLGAAMTIAEATADDGEQRALDYAPADLEGLLELRLRVREKLAGVHVGLPLLRVREKLAGVHVGLPLLRVMPWLWRRESGGRPRSLESP